MATRSPLQALTLNDDILVYRGPAELSGYGLSFTISAVIRLQWLPYPRIVMEFIQVSEGELEIGVSYVLRIPEYNDTKCYVIEPINSSDTHAVEYRSLVSGSLTPYELSEPRAGLGFHIINFQHYIGAMLPDRDGNKFSALSWEIDTGDTKIRLEQRDDYNQLHQSLKSRGGYLISHVGQWSFARRKKLGLEEFQELERALRYFLGFANGRWAGPVLPFDLESGQLLQTTSCLVTPYRFTHTWFPVTRPRETSGLYIAVKAWLDDPDRRETMRNSIEWYVDANVEQNLEASLIKAQVALEMLEWFILVGPEKKMSKTKYGKLSAAHRLAMILKYCSIPETIPKNQVDLAKACSDLGLQNGPVDFPAFHRHLQVVV